MKLAVQQSWKTASSKVNSRKSCKAMHISPGTATLCDVKRESHMQHIAYFSKNWRHLLSSTIFQCCSHPSVRHDGMSVKPTLDLHGSTMVSLDMFELLAILFFGSLKCYFQKISFLRCAGNAQPEALPAIDLPRQTHQLGLQTRSLQWTGGCILRFSVSSIR